MTIDRPKYEGFDNKKGGLFQEPPFTYIKTGVRKIVYNRLLTGYA